MSAPNVLIFGLGAIGSIYACILKLSGQAKVYVVARSSYQAVKDKGLKLTSPKFGDHDGIRFDGVFRNCEDAAASGVTFDYVICATKALLDAKPSLEDQIRPVVSPNSSIAILQNGVGAEAPLHAAFPSSTIISAVVWTGGKVLGDGHIEQFNRESLTIGVDWKEDAAKEDEQGKLDRLVGILRAGGGDCTVHPKIQEERWAKIMWNCCWNGLTTAIVGKTNLLWLSSEEHSLQMCRALMGEVHAVARAKGLVIPETKAEELIQTCKNVDAGLPSSMLFDSLAGRPMEVESILGTPLKEGLRLGVPVPSLLTLYTIVKTIDYRNLHAEEAKI